jgi:hypothetical protein
VKKLRLFSAFFALSAGSFVALAASSVGASTFGVNAHVPLDPVADEIVEAGIGWVRVDFVWKYIEPERDVYTWQRYDRLIDRLEARGLRIYAGFGSTPAWATIGSEYSGVPDDPAEWQEFCYLAASRYRGRVDAWGIWNEPNTKRFWEGTRAQYIEIMLLPGTDAIRAADPGALVCAPDLAHLSSGHWDDWLYEVIRKAGHAIDVVTHHNYPSFGTANEVIYELDTKLNIPFTSPSIRRLLKETGWWGRPFWLTETGLQSERYGEDAQAEFFEDLLTDWFGPHPRARWMDRIFFYHMNDGKPPSTHSYGIIGHLPDLDRKSTFYAYQHFISDAVIDDAEIITHAFPAFVDSNTVMEIPVTVRNTGTTTWTAATGHFLDITTVVRGWELVANPFPDGIEVAPDETVEIWVRLRTAPNPLGPSASTVIVDARMADGEGDRFGDPLRARMVHTDSTPPVVQIHPRPVTVRAGNRTFFAVDVESPSPVRYRWRRNSVWLSDGEGIVGSNTRWLRISGVDSSSDGDYDCVITNDAGSIVTQPARLTLGIASPRRPSDRTTPPAVAVTRTR